MNAEFMLAAARNLAIAAVILLLLQLTWSVLRRRAQMKDVVNNRLTASHEQTGLVDNGQGIAMGRFDRLLYKAGMNLTYTRLATLMMVVATSTLFVGALFGWVMAVLVPVLALALGALLWKVRYEKRRRTIFESLPTIIDETIRGIDAGRSLENSLVDAFREAPPVFERVTFRLRSAVDSGRDYTHLMDEFAEIYDVPPLVFVAVALRTSSRFGSSVRAVLKEVSRSLRAQQELRREFMAATAETRFTAAAFAIMPPGLGVAMVALNKSFRDVLLHTSTGHMLLGISLALIALAVVVIFRMVQGVGRG
ncbi:type II secretion system F family protein [Isoalcanivorax beigongshangi]|uniref:Type II secretion system F family protein n=1 Tax=Isoalcanivorax beigongshangi TaxID=3238810 RepID=A0ABV4ACI0_9GAMM